MGCMESQKVLTFYILYVGIPMKEGHCEHIIKLCSFLEFSYLNSRCSSLGIQC